MTRGIRAAFAAVFVGSACGAAASDDVVFVDVDATLHNSANPVIVELAAGTYVVTPIGIADGGAYEGWNPWGNATCATPTGCPQTLPTTDTGWKTSYEVLSDAITAVNVGEAALSPVPAEPTGFEQIQDYWIASASQVDRYHVDEPIVYPSASDGLTSAESSSFVLAQPGPVGFAIRDADLDDNLGGVSLAIPEPSEPLMLGSGAAAVLVGARTRRAARAARAARRS